MKKYNKVTKSLAAPGKGVQRFARPDIRVEPVQGKTEVDYFRFYESLYRKEVSDWQRARAVRRDPFNPVTYHLQQIYKDAMLDNHLSGAIENRILRVVNKQFIVKDAEGNPDNERSAWVQKRWFRHLIRKCLESKFYGYSMVFISDVTSGEIRKVVDIPRENIIPEYGLLLKESLNTTGTAIRYGDYPNFFIYTQLLPDPVGILERIAPLTIFKRHSWASWDEFEQLFGVPIRIARTLIDSKKHKDDLQQWLEMMGSASYGIFDKRVDIEVKENSKSDSYNVFLQKITVLNKEISKGINGQTMTMDDGSSQSQAEVHLQIQEEITQADIQDIEDWVCDDFFPAMRAWGYDIPEGYYLDIMANSSVKPGEKIKVDDVLMRNGFIPSRDYVEQTYEITLDKKEPYRKKESEDLSFFD